MTAFSLPFPTVSESGEEILLSGTCLSEGIAIGIVYFPQIQADEDIPQFAITADQVDREIERYRKALALSRQDLEHLQCSLAGEGLQDAVSIISAHLEMLKDPFLTVEIEGKIRRELCNTETVFRSTIQEFASRFSKSAGTFFEQRLVDVMDVSSRVLGHLRKSPKNNYHEAPLGSIVIASDIDASATASAQARRISAFVTAGGASGSHAALIARSRGIPYVGTVDIALLIKARGKIAIVDGAAGKVIVNPKKETVAEYRKKQYQSIQTKEKHEPLKDWPAETFDGHQIKLMTNIGSIEEVEMLPRLGTDGVGLVRTEFLFSHLDQDCFHEEAQLALFNDIIRKMDGKPIIMRLFDFGGDKKAPNDKMSHNEANPLMGCRGIRFLFRHPLLFKNHLRALLRASVEGDLRLLVPFVSQVDEMKLVRQTIYEVGQELKKEGIAHRQDLPVGCMLEVPSALLLVDFLVKYADFFSVGTNDLTQYILGIDRINPALEAFYQPIHPSILRLIRMAVLEAKSHARPICLCGEIASQPLFAPLFVGLGIEELSVVPRSVALIKYMLRNCSVIDAYRIAREAIQQEDASSVHQLLQASFGKFVTA
jgi:phosphoenolpyruvate-protein phosphotransferase (PTS system enzyme I)